MATIKKDEIKYINIVEYIDYLGGFYRLIRFFPWVESSQDSHYAIHKKRDILNPT